MWFFGVERIISLSLTCDNEIKRTISWSYVIQKKKTVKEGKDLTYESTSKRGVKLREVASYLLLSRSFKCKKNCCFEMEEKLFASSRDVFPFPSAMGPVKNFSFKIFFFCFA